MFFGGHGVRSTLNLVQLNRDSIKSLSLSLSLSLKRDRDSGGLESEGLTLSSGSVLKGRTLPMSQISGPQVLAESSTVTSQAVSSFSERESATTHSGSAAADPSRK